MRYLAALDHDHLDNGVFLTALARSLAQQQQSDNNIRSIIVHTDSEYTERIIQTGVMREEATIRSLKDLNKRLVALLADEGVSTIGINPYKRNFITLKNGKLQLDRSFLENISDEPVLLISTLVQDLDRNKEVAVELPKLLSFLQKELNSDDLVIFSKSDKAEVFTNNMPSKLSWESMDKEFREVQIPDEFSKFNRRCYLTTARDFGQFPSHENAILIIE
jgi:hypothetical protein